MKKAQIKTMETIAILIVFFMLMLFVLVTYFSFKTSSNQEETSEINYLRAINKYYLVYHLPELQSSLASVEAGSTLDIMKLDAISETKYKIDSVGSQVIKVGLLKTEPEFRQLYVDLLGYATIEITPIYTWNDNYDPNAVLLKQRWVVYNNTKPNSNSESFTMPVALYYQPTNIYYLGQIEISVYDG